MGGGVVCLGNAREVLKGKNGCWWMWWEYVIDVEKEEIVGEN